MGLDTTHDCWHGAYSAFMRWREQIAEAAGFPPLKLMQGFFSWEEPGSISLVRSAVKERWGDEQYLQSAFKGLPIKWTYFEKDPLSILLFHSDCDGEIDAKDCGPIADRLEEVLKSVPETTDLGGHVGNFHQKTRQFIEGLRDASSKGESVEFH